MPLEHKFKKTRMALRAFLLVCGAPCQVGAQNILRIKAFVSKTNRVPRMLLDAKDHLGGFGLGLHLHAGCGCAQNIEGHSLLLL